jgi:hypothetical protein
MYDAWSAYDDRAVGTQLGGALRRPARERTLANKEQAISYAAPPFWNIAITTSPISSEISPKARTPIGPATLR